MSYVKIAARKLKKVLISSENGIYTKTRMFMFNSKYNTCQYSLKYNLHFRYLAYVSKLRRISVHTG